MADTEEKKAPKEKRVKLRKVQKELNRKEVHEKRIETSQKRRQEDKGPEGT
jgi:hypothetical protein